MWLCLYRRECYLRCAGRDSRTTPATATAKAMTDVASFGFTLARQPIITPLRQSTGSRLLQSFAQVSLHLLHSSVACVNGEAARNASVRCINLTQMRSQQWSKRPECVTEEWNKCTICNTLKRSSSVMTLASV
jgi:hypothetical protein